MLEIKNYEQMQISFTKISMVEEKIGLKVFVSLKISYHALPLPYHIMRCPYLQLVWLHPKTAVPSLSKIQIIITFTASAITVTLGDIQPDIFFSSHFLNLASIFKIFKICSLSTKCYQILEFRSINNSALLLFYSWQKNFF